MAKRILQQSSFTPAGIAEASAVTGNFMAIKGGSGTQQINVIEFYLGGQAGASAPSVMQWARSGTIASTPTALPATGAASDGPMSTATAALAAPPVTFIAATTGPIRSQAAADARLNLSFNAFGGIVRWVAAPGEEWQILGATAVLGESSLSATSAGTPGLMGAHIVYEPF